MSLSNMYGGGFSDIFSSITGCSPTNTKCIANKASGIVQSIAGNKPAGKKITQVLDYIAEKPETVDNIVNMIGKLKTGSGILDNTGNRKSKSKPLIGGCGDCGKCPKSGKGLFIEGRDNRIRAPRTPYEVARMDGNGLMIEGRGMKKPEKKKINVSMRDALKTVKSQKGKGMVVM